MFLSFQSAFLEQGQLVALQKLPARTNGKGEMSICLKVDFVFLYVDWMESDCDLGCDIGCDLSLFWNFSNANCRFWVANGRRHGGDG